METNTEQWNKEALSAWLEEVISRELRVSVSDIRKVRRFDALGVDSLLAAYIAAELTSRLGRQINIDTVYDQGDVYSLAAKMGG